MNTDWIYSFLFLLTLAMLLLIAERIFTRLSLSTALLRKSVHVLTGLFLVVAILAIDSKYPIVIIASGFILFNAWALYHGKILSIHPDQNSLGTIFYPVSVLVLSILLWDYSKLILIISVLILSLADVMAAVTGERYGYKKLHPFREEKSIIGSAAMFFVSFLVIICILFIMKFAPHQIWIIAFIVAIQATAAEMISIRGSDNLSVPLVTALFLYMLLDQGLDTDFYQVVSGTIYALILAVFSITLGFLQLGGAIALVIMGGIIFGIGGIQYAIPILTFFILSSLLSYVKRRYKKQFLTTFEKGDRRDLIQVLANGGWATIIVVLTIPFGKDLLFPVYLATLCAAAADTWATELGVLSPHKPRLINSLRVAEKGTSGAVSVTGLTAALFGSTVVFFSGYLIDHSFFTLNVAIIVIISGFLGSLVDSIFGATIQVQYCCTTCHQITERQEHCGFVSEKYRGYDCMQNDTVNFVSIGFSTLISTIFIILI